MMQFVLLNTTSVENLTRKVKIWTLAVHIDLPVVGPNHKPFQTITYPLTTTEGASTAPLRKFAILHSKPGENPFDLGYYGNFKAVMGDNFLDWVLPLRYSPCHYHESLESAFALGAVVRRMRQEAGLLPFDDIDGTRNDRRRRKSRHRSRGDHKDQRPTPADKLKDPRKAVADNDVATTGGLVQ